MPATTKVNIDQRGCPTDNGVVAFKDIIAPEDSAVVANLRKAGMIVVGRTNTPASRCGGSPTTSCTAARSIPGIASHGGRVEWRRCGAAVASGIGPIAQGNDIAGSVRFPGVLLRRVGLRPTYGRIPGFNFTATGKRTISSALMAVQGPLTRTVRDARAALAAMAVGSAYDNRWVDVPLEGPSAKRPIRVAMVVDPAGRVAWRPRSRRRSARPPAG